MPSVLELECFFNERQNNQVQYLIDLQDNGPEELRLEEYIDASVFEAHCVACKLKRVERRQARKHKRQTFSRRT